MLIHPIIPEPTEVRRSASNHSDTLRLAYLFDLSCPWCYMGLRNLRKAVTDSQNVQIRLLPFLINQDVPPEGAPFVPYMERRFGGDVRLEKTLAVVRSFAHRDGLNLAFERIERVPNTIAAHALVQLAQDKGCALSVLEDIFSAYFCQGRNIGNPDELLSIALDAGLDRDEVRQHLGSSTVRGHIQALNQQAHHVGLSRVPCLIVNERHALPGAQDAGIIRQFVTLMRDVQ